MTRLAAVVVGSILSVQVSAGATQEPSAAHDMRSRLDHVVVEAAPGWMFRTLKAAGGDQIYVWQRDDDRVLMLRVGSFSNERQAHTFLRNTRLSLGTRPLTGIGDEGFYADLPGGHTNVYLRVDNLIVHLTMPSDVAAAHRIAAGAARELAAH